MPNELIDVERLAELGLLSRLLDDKSSGEKIIFGSDAYLNEGVDAEDRLTSAFVLGGFNGRGIRPRVLKSQEEQNARVRTNAEVFTPTWICNFINNRCDRDYFKRPNVFNREVGQTREVSNAPVYFHEKKKRKRKAWQRYVDSRRLEITCGEAPFLVSRYDATTGEILPLERRVGVLDRKLRVVKERATSEQEWLKWAFRAFQSVYGYEYQGDNLLIARVNLVSAFCEYARDALRREPTEKELSKLVNIVVWNLWQMNGLTDAIPFGEVDRAFEVRSFWGTQVKVRRQTFCKIFDWRSRKPLLFKDLKDRKRNNAMKFDYVVGNPPYQDDTRGENETFAPPIYHEFMDASYKVASKVILIHPARFLFNAGSTPKAWNKKTLADEHFKILYYEQKSDKVFAGTDIKGGVAISYRDETKNFGAIERFTSYPELNSILKKVKNAVEFQSIRPFVLSRTSYRFTETMHEEHPDAEKRLSVGHRCDVSTNIFDRLPDVFLDQKPDDGKEYIQILGRQNNERVYKFVRRDYIASVSNFEKYKIFVPDANGSGAIGEVLSAPLIGAPLIGATESFISIGAFETRSEAEAAFKYVKSKFARTMLGVLKITQHNAPPTWEYVPLQDFTSSSVIDWNRSISEIDRQLYKKYGLTSEEIEFIESKVRSME